MSVIGQETLADTFYRLDRVRASTPRSINERIDRETAERVRGYARAPREALSRRIGELEREWDIERVLERNAALLALTGLALGIGVHRRWLLLPGVVMSFLFQHAVQGWCPPLLILRPLGIRTQREIEAEKYALKALRGDFAGVAESTAPEARVQEALLAAATGRRQEPKAA